MLTVFKKNLWNCCYISGYNSRALMIFHTFSVRMFRSTITSDIVVVVVVKTSLQ